MRKFSFSLEAVLDYRRVLEEKEQEKLQKINQAIFQAQHSLNLLRNEIDDCRQMVVGCQKGIIDIDKIRYLVAYIEKLELEVIQLTLHIAQLDKEKAQQLEKVIQAKRRREVVDKLKEKKLAHYEREARELEQKLLDELAIVNFRHEDVQELPGGKDNP
ncbi:MAG TPA: flagellar export protein FliJ [Terriglobia bacterium]|nr:flagellar export protein FliJ [Terriglobia bacterium]